MKKLLFIVMCLFIFSCKPLYNNQKSEYIIPGNSNTNTTIVANGSYVGKHNIVYPASKYVSIFKFKYYGHKYIIFDNSVIHDPNCECYNK
jgi:hypothetical protein